VAFLKRMLQQRTDSITELTDRLEGMKVRGMGSRKDRLECMEMKGCVTARDTKMTGLQVGQAGRHECERGVANRTGWRA
jgi:hypothetical protein